VLQVGDLDPIGDAAAVPSRWSARVRIEVHDVAETLYSGAVITGIWSEGASGEGSCTTNSIGVCQLSTSGLKRSSVPSVRFTITGVSLEGHAYAPGLNHDSDGDSDGNTVVVVQP